MSEISGKITVRVHRVAGFTPGAEISIDVDAVGTPLDLFWRRRLRDAKRDQCCEVVVHHGVTEHPPVDEGWEEEPES